MNSRIRTKRSLCCATLLAAFFPAAASRADIRIDFLPDLPGGRDFGSARGVSPDGRFVVGVSSSAEAPFSTGEAFLWSEDDGTMGLGDLPGGAFNSLARDVSADGNVVVGFAHGPSGKAAFRWVRGVGMLDLGDLPGGNVHADAYAISADGSTIVGNSSSTLSPGGVLIPGAEAFLWRGTMRGLGLLDREAGGGSGARALSPDGNIVAGFGARELDGGEVIQAGFVLHGNGAMEPLVDVHGVTPSGVSADGNVVVGALLANPEESILSSPFRWTRQDGLHQLAPDGGGASGVSANGLVTIAFPGRIFLGNDGPFSLLEILQSELEIDEEDFRCLAPLAISDDGLTIVGHVCPDGITTTVAFRLQFSDCDGNGLPDEVERFAGRTIQNAIAVGGSERFAADREGTTFESMVAHYGKPWAPQSEQTPSLQDSDPAARLRALRVLPVCENVPLENLRERLFEVVVPATDELFQFEMLLGNEAFSDAVDPTVGLDGIPTVELANHYAFDNVPGIFTPLDEELALLRGRDLAGDPEEWIDDAVQFPQFSNADGDAIRAAVYNRLPPNAGRASAVAYRSTYQVTDDFAAAQAFPQGHGDAFGYYLTATRAYLDLFGQAASVPGGEQLTESLLEALATDDGMLGSLENLARATTARARTVERVVELTFRRDYREDPADPRAADVLRDPDPERAWSALDWSSRGFLGAYFDWALLSQWAPVDSARPISRDSLLELGELANTASKLQERADAASGGLDPLGLLPNVVPFGIDASGLEPGSGRSHYEQVRDAAKRAIDNARSVLELANQADQRLRNQTRDLAEFQEQAGDLSADLDARLTEVFGFPSPDDVADNDLDPETSDIEESLFHPDLVNFLLTDDDLAARGMAPRPAPGEVQLALSELKIAELRVDEIELEIDNHSEELREQLDRIALLSRVQVERLEIVADACADQMNLTRRLEDIENRKKAAGIFSSAIKVITLRDPQALVGFVGNMIDEITYQVLAEIDGLGTEFDVEVERQRVECWKTMSIQGLEDELSLQVEYDRLAAICRQTPQLLLNRSVASEVVSQSVGRVRRAVQQGTLLMRDRDRVRSRLSADVAEERYRDMSFRVFRAGVLEKYRAFFDLAARYVVLAARAYAYEFNARSEAENVLTGIYRERLLGAEGGVSGGLEGVLLRLDNSVVVNNFNRSFESFTNREFSFRENMLGIGTRNFPTDDLEFRAFVESSIVDRVEEIPEIRELAQISSQRDFGPGIVIPFATEVGGRNFFGRGPDIPFGNANFSLSRNIKIRSYAIRFDGVEADLGTAQDGTVFIYLLPVGDSVMRENNNRPVIEDEPPRSWSVVSQFLPSPPVVSAADVTDRSFNPWRATGHAGGNFLNAIRRERDSEAQMDRGQPNRFNTNLAGRSAWNTRWLLVVPGAQWTESTDPQVIRGLLQQFIYGTNADPEEHIGLNDIRLILNAYSH